MTRDQAGLEARILTMARVYAVRVERNGDVEPDEIARHGFDIDEVRANWSRVQELGQQHVADARGVKARA